MRHVEPTGMASGTLDLSTSKVMWQAMPSLGVRAPTYPVILTSQSPSTCFMNGVEKPSYMPASSRPCGMARCACAGSGAGCVDWTGAGGEKGLNALDMCCWLLSLCVQLDAVRFSD